MIASPEASPFSNHNDYYSRVWSYLFVWRQQLVDDFSATIVHNGVYILKIETQRSGFISASMFYKREYLCWAYHLSPPHHTVLLFYALSSSLFSTPLYTHPPRHINHSKGFSILLNIESFNLYTYIVVHTSRNFLIYEDGNGWVRLHRLHHVYAAHHFDLQVFCLFFNWVYQTQCI